MLCQKVSVYGEWAWKDPTMTMMMQGVEVVRWFRGGKRCLVQIERRRDVVVLDIDDYLEMEKLGVVGRDNCCILQTVPWTSKE